MKQNKFTALVNAKDIKDIVALLPKKIQKDPFLNIEKHFYNEYHRLAKGVDEAWALSWIKQKAGHTLKCTYEQQKVLNPLLKKEQSNE